MYQLSAVVSPQCAQTGCQARLRQHRNSAATAKWRWTCSHGADAAPEWPALLTTTTTATLMLRADPSYPTVALFHVSLTLRKNLKRRAAESPTSRSACLLVSRTVLTHP